MVSRDDKPSFLNRDEGWKNKKSRDDTPSFIRDVQARAEMLNPNRNGEAIPVLAMPKSVRLWRKIRWPLFIAIVVLLLAVIGIFTNNRLVARSVASKIDEAAALEAAAKIDGLLAAEQTLSALAQRHPGRPNAQAANAWHSVLLAELFGPKEKYLAAATPSLALLKNDATALGWAARAGAEHLAGKDEQALALADQGLKAFPGEPRLELVRTWALVSLGRRDDAATAIAELRKGAPQYLPAAQFALLNAMDGGDLKAVKRYSAELLTFSPGDMIGALGSIAVRLPGWNEAADPTQAATMLEDMATLKSHFEKAPANIGALGFFLSGRTNLASGKVAEAISDLRASLDKRKSEKVLAWYALAVRRKDGPTAALALFGAADEGKSAEVESIKAQCHLDLHHIDDASKAIAAMAAAGTGDSGELGWILAVRSGDAEKAEAALPASIDSRLQWVGLEMHDLLRDRGDADGIATLAERFEETACADAIRAWHSADVGRILSVFDSPKKREVPCVAALTARLMRGHIAPAELRSSAEAAVAASEGDMRTRVDRALAIWLTDGRDAAAKALDEIVAARPEGAGLLAALSDAYLAMGLPERAVEVLSSCKSAACTGLRIAAWKGSKTPERAAAELDAAMAAGADRKEPGIAVALMERDLEARRLDEVIASADEVFPTAGRWAAQVAELKAKAQSTKGDRGDADRTLLAAADKVVKGVGIGESWRAKLALVRMNLNRGGNFVFKAFAVAFEMYKAGVKDAELSYSYAVANIDQGNERGALRYLREAIDLDPSFVPAYTRLKIVDTVPEEALARLALTMPGVQP
jgi:tetratricopeptide (TPR) repeat protein